MAFFGKGKTTGRLARLSARGRMRQNVALFTVLFLLFLFVGAVISWIGIAKKTETEQRFDAYGEWKAAFYGGDEERVRAFLDNPLTTRSGLGRIVGEAATEGAGEKIRELKEISKGDPEGEEFTFRDMLGRYMGIDEYEYDGYFGICGSIGTMDAGFVELGRISMEEGEFPERKDEVAMTRSMLLRMGFGAELGERVDLEIISGEGEVLKQSYRLCGILEDYGGNWQTKGYPLASAVLSEEAAEAVPWETSWNILTDVDGIVGDTRYIYKIAEEPMEVVKRFAFNSYAYDFWGRTDDAYVWIVLLIVVLTAVVTVFQITGTQIRKRSRQVGLLKAIGATNAQVRRIFLGEVTGILWRAAVPGTLSGLFLVPAVLWGSGLAKRQRLYYGLDVFLLLGAVAVCFVTTWLGALLPIWKGSRIPVRGELQPKNVRFCPMKAEKKYSARKIVSGRGGGLFRMAVILLLAASASSAFLAAYQAGREMAPYRNGERALYYRLYFNGGLSRITKDSMDGAILEQLAQIPGVEAVYTRKNGVSGLENFYISYEGVEECELERLRKQWHLPPYSYLFAKPSVKKRDRALAGLMGIDTGWEQNLEGIEEMVTEGAFDREAFCSGREVLLFLPSYREKEVHEVEEGTTKIAVCTDARYQDFYERETCIRPGDTIRLVVSEEVIDFSEDIGEDKKQDPKLKYKGTREISVTVGGIIRSLPQDTRNPLWNANCERFYEEDVLQPFTVIADGELVNEVRLLHRELLAECERKEREAAGEPYDEAEAMFYGRYMTSWGIDVPYDNIEVLCDPSVSETTEGSIKNLAELYGMQAVTFGSEREDVDYEAWKAGYKEAFNRTALWLVAAVAGMFVFTSLLLQNVNERLAEDRRRLGIFEALGVGRREMGGGYLLKGFKNGLLALLLAHGALLFSAVWQTREAASALSSRRFASGRETFLHWFDLWFGSYGWGWHVFICAVVLAFSTALYLMPLREVLKNSPVENIRELGE
ncbi:MAG: ABC transporter permease [Lachnospiraceae bacterium]|nr:ABC transporter permease [Lachnospiraceae bacterium]